MTSKPYHVCFETLANDLRLKILENLEKKPMPVEQLAKALGAERSRVSHSLKMLRDCSYVDVKKQGKERIYSVREGAMYGITSAPKNSIITILDDHKAHQCHNMCKKLNQPITG